MNIPAIRSASSSSRAYSAAAEPQKALVPPINLDCLAKSSRWTLGQTAVSNSSLPAGASTVGVCLRANKARAARVAQVSPKQSVSLTDVDGPLMKATKWGAAPAELVAPAELANRMLEALRMQRDSGNEREAGGWVVLNKDRFAYTPLVLGFSRRGENKHFPDNAVRAVNPDGRMSLEEESAFSTAHPSLMMFHTHPRETTDTITWPQSSADLAGFLKQPTRLADAVVTTDGVYLLLRTDETVSGHPAAPAQMATNRDTPDEVRDRWLDEASVIANTYRFHLYYAPCPEADRPLRFALRNR